jgi:DNA-binding transcriptional LysR family regulator
LRLRWWRNHHPELDRISASEPSIEAPMEAARFLCIQGTAAGFFPATYIAEDVRAGRLRTIAVRDLAPLIRTTALVRKQHGTVLTPATTSLIAALRTQASALGILAGHRNDKDPLGPAPIARRRAPRAR